MSENGISKKCVMVIDADLPTGLIANTVAVLSVTIGHRIAGIVGPDVMDASGQHHAGITRIPIPILHGTAKMIKELRIRAYAENESGMFVVDFCDVAQKSKDYDAYTKAISLHNTNDLQYLGLAIYGESRKVNKLTGSLPLLR